MEQSIQITWLYVSQAQVIHRVKKITPKSMPLSLYHLYYVSILILSTSYHAMLFALLYI
jgi:hypothetical protein